jgi:hypothetical protein
MYFFYILTKGNISRIEVLFSFSIFDFSALLNFLKKTLSIMFKRRIKEKRGGEFSPMTSAQVMPGDEGAAVL